MVRVVSRKTLRRLTLSVLGLALAALTRLGQLITSAPTPAHAQAASCPCTIFAPTAAPVTANGGDVNSVEVGVKFRADTSGFITGVRFYKMAINTSAHTGSLWTSTGTLLGRATFTSESASGGQDVTFGSPVAIQANTTYVASYNTVG